MTSTVSSAYVDVRQHDAYTACPDDETHSMLCEPGATAIDDEDGDLTSTVLVCPPDSCLSVGCPGHTWATKGMQGCINTSSPVGTIFSVRFVVFDRGTPQRNATVTRVVTITSRCDVEEDLCDDLTCSPVDCDLRESLLADPVDTSPPAIFFLGQNPVRVRYGSAADAALLQPCTNGSGMTGNASASGCYAISTDSNDGDVTASLVVQQDTQGNTFISTACPFLSVHRCFPGTYGFIYAAFDAAGNRGVARLVVVVIEQAAVQTKTILSLGLVSFSEACEQTVLLLDDTSAEAGVFQQGISELLNAAVAAPGEDVWPGDVQIMDVVVRDNETGFLSTATNCSRGSNNASTLPSTNMSSSEFSLEVFFSVSVSVAMRDEQSLSAKLRHLLQSADATLTTRTSDVAAVLNASASDGRMSVSLASAGEGSNASLDVDVLGVVGNLTSSVLTPEVDELKASEASMYEEIQKMGRMSDELQRTLDGLTKTVQGSTGNPGQWVSNLMELWASAVNSDFANVEQLSNDAETLLEKLRQLIRSYELVNEGQEEVALALQGTLQAMEEELIDLSVQYVKIEEALGRASDIARPPPPTNRHISIDYTKYDDRELPLNDVTDPFSYAPSEAQARYIALRRNRLVGGILFYMKRGRHGGICTYRFASLGAPCYPGVVSQRYGSDPVFVPGKRLYRSHQYESG
ncbi:hypothetical protein CYMTET_3328 [Cymbomonas tetramitiformis]|uniref:Uncharacterized protein n=1 Tax=Cymbomonas tetramitiformis TaxID=36881 RepID=A0AAE0H3H2_9CHLO|nr:hypothetical protein CYMTET_3328 [Cymbomonas tetramitiformis]